MKVLQIIDGESFSGIVKYISGISNNIKEIDFDFLTSVNICDNWNNLGVSRKTLKGKITYNHRLRKYLKKNKYDIVHINSGVFLFSFQVAIICKLSKVKKVIVHSHSNPHLSIIKRFLRKILNPLYRKITKAHLACSSIAAKALFTKTNDVIILKNGIEIDKYKFDEKSRKEYRNNLKIDNKTVYCHIGYFSKQKNHEFLIDVFNELLKKDKNSVLLLIGEGPLKNQIKDKVKKLKIEDNVLFLGFREDINNILYASDVFLLPSTTEGLGIVLIEAQTSGLPVVVSNGIPNEAKISKEFYKIETYDIDKWINQINKIKKKNRNNSYKDAINSGYDIKEISEKLKKIYTNI